MKIGKISQCQTKFSGKIIFPEKLSPKLEDFKKLTEERVSDLIENQPFDVIVYEVKHGDSYIPRVECRRIREEKVNPFSLIILDDIVSKAKDKILLDEIVEDMKRFEKEILEKAEIKEEIPLKNKIYIPNTIGRNSQINNKPKSNTKFIKHR